MRTAPALTLAVAAGLNPLAYGFDVSLVDWATTVLDTGLPAGGVHPGDPYRLVGAKKPST